MENDAPHFRRVYTCDNCTESYHDDGGLWCDRYAFYVYEAGVLSIPYVCDSHNYQK